MPDRGAGRQVRLAEPPPVKSAFPVRPSWRPATALRETESRYGVLPEDLQCWLGEGPLAVDERLDLKRSAADKQLLAQAAAIEGLSRAALVRLAARQSAAEAIPRERQLLLSQRAFTAFHAAIGQAFAANTELDAVMEQAPTRVRRV